MPKLSDIRKETHFKKGNSDLPKLRKWADVPALLDRLGIEYKRSGQELKACCPSKAHDDKNPSWSIRDERGDESNGLFRCYSCKWSGDIFKLVCEVKGCSFAESVKIVKGEGSDAIDVSIELTVDVNAEMGFRDYWPNSISIPGGVEEIVKGSKCCDYLFSRGVRWNDIQRFGLMDWKWKRRVFVPLFFQGYMISWLARTYVDDEIKVLNQPGKNGGIKWGLFGMNLLNRTNQVIHLTEGWVDAIRIYQAGFPNVLAVCGSMLTEEKIKQLTWVRKIVYWPDGDVPGQKFSLEVRNWFYSFADVEFVEIEDGFDPGDYTSFELQQLTRHR